MSPALQVKLLRVLQEREIMRVAAPPSSHRRADRGRHQRVSGAEGGGGHLPPGSVLPSQHPAIVIPPLSERGDDLFLILEQFQKELGGSFRLTPQVRGFLKSYSWPGNIRELLERSGVLSLHWPRSHHHGGPAPTVFHRAPQRRSGSCRRRRSSLLLMCSALCWNSCIRPQRPGSHRPGAAAAAGAGCFCPHFPTGNPKHSGQMADQGLVRVSRGRGGSS